MSSASSSRYPPVPTTLSSSFISCSFDIRDTNNIWTPATIQRIDMEHSRVLVHYQDWPSRWDEYIPFPSTRIARYLSKRPDDAYGRPRQRNIATVTSLKYGYHRHQAIMALDKVGDIDSNGQRNFMAAIQWLQNNVDVPDDEEDEIYMDDYILPSDVEYETEDEDENEIVKPVIAIAVDVAKAVSAWTVTPITPPAGLSDTCASLPIPPPIIPSPSATPSTPTSPSMDLIHDTTTTSVLTLPPSAGMIVTAQIVQ